MNMLTFGDLKTSELPATLNLCPDDIRFARRVNRAIEWLLTCGSFWGTTRKMELCTESSCVVLPGMVATLDAVRGCRRAIRIENQWYRMLPGFNPHAHCTGDLWFEYHDNVCSFKTLCHPRILRSFVSNLSDVGKTIKFLGYDHNRIWVRTNQGGIMQDGEVVTLANPFADTLTLFSSVTAVVKPETADSVRVFQKPGDSDVLHPFGLYEYWETRPSYQRYKIEGHERLEEEQHEEHRGGRCNDHCRENVVEAEVKLAFAPVKNDDDILLISNRPGLEMAVMGVKALDDGDLARADALLFGNAANQRLGAIPLLNNEIRTNSGDRFSASVRVNGPCGFKTLMKGFI